MRFIRMMGHMHDGGPPPVKCVKDVKHADTRILVEHCGRLVEHHHRRIHRDDPGDGDALLLAAAHRRRIIFDTRHHADRFECMRDLIADARAAHPQILRSEGHIVAGDGRDNLILRILKHRADIMSGEPVLVGMRARGIEYRMPVQRDHTRIRGGKPCKKPGKC